mmetsp:Transcript_7391/g.12482  ORF Transcript_7391/g.12482 Transcript_7391/m.12482 type:complete len:226 (+) Transcript_7391:586-1263(+)
MLSPQPSGQQHEAQRPQPEPYEAIPGPDGISLDPLLKAHQQISVRLQEQMGDQGGLHPTQRAGQVVAGPFLAPEPVEDPELALAEAQQLFVLVDDKIFILQSGHGLKTAAQVLPVPGTHRRDVIRDGWPKHRHVRSGHGGEVQVSVGGGANLQAAICAQHERAGAMPAHTNVVAPEPCPEPGQMRHGEDGTTAPLPHICPHRPRASVRADTSVVVQGEPPRIVDW